MKVFLHYIVHFVDAFDCTLTDFFKYISILNSNLLSNNFYMDLAMNLKKWHYENCVQCWACHFESNNLLGSHLDNQTNLHLFVNLLDYEMQDLFQQYSSEQCWAHFNDKAVVCQNSMDKGNSNKISSPNFLFNLFNEVFTMSVFKAPAKDRMINDVHGHLSYSRSSNWDFWPSRGVFKQRFYS